MPEELNKGSAPAGLNEAAAQSDLLKDPFIKRVITEDPFFRLLYHWRRPLLWTAAVVLCVGYLWYYLKQSYDQSLRHAADIYTEMRRELNAEQDVRQQADRVKAEAAALPPEQGDKKKELEDKEKQLLEELKRVQARLDGKLTALGDQKEPYSSIGAAYRLLSAVRRGEDGRLQKELAGWSLERAAGGDGRPDRYRELGALLGARALLDREETQAPARALLRSLGEKGRWARIPAALALAQVASSEAEKTEALALLEQIKASEPEQGGLLDEEIERLKS